MKYIFKEMDFFNPTQYEKFSYDFLLSFNNENNVFHILFISNEDYSVIKDFQFEAFRIRYLENKIIIIPNSNFYFEINASNLILSKIDSKIVPAYIFNNNLCYYYSYERKEYLYFVNEIERIFKIPENKIQYNFISDGILEYFRDIKNDNWLQLMDPSTGEIKWRKDYEYEICMIQEYDNVIVFCYNEYSGIRTDQGYEGEVDWGNPKRYNIGLDAETGKEIWRIQRPRHGLDFRIDKDRSSMLCMQSNFYNISNGHIESANILEIDLKTGTILLNVQVTPHDLYGFTPHFADDEAVYYVNSQGSFGKIRRSDGIIEWEFDLVDSKGVKRKVLNWLKLGNGKFVLQTPPNHKNGDLTCIFDPEENMEEASIINGIRVKEILKGKK